MIALALESKEGRNDAKGTKKKKWMNVAALETQCRSIGRNIKIGSSFNAAALKTQCRSIGKKTETRKLAEW